MNENKVEIHLDEEFPENLLKLKEAYLERLLSDRHGNGIGEEYKGPEFIPCSTDLDLFIDLLKKFIEKDQENKKRKIILMDDFSKNNIFENPHSPGQDVLGVITYSLTKRAHGTTKGGNQPFDSARTERVPQYRGRLKNPEGKPNSYKFFFGQWYDNLISFNIHARSNKEANDIAAWFEKIMEESRVFFAFKGILKYHFIERQSDTVFKEGDGVIHVRPMVYWVRTEKVYEITENAIEKIIIFMTTL